MSELNTTDTNPYSRPRVVSLLLLLGAGAAGALIRFGGLLSPWLAKYGGDAAWAAAWVFLIMAVRPRWSAGRAAAAAAAVCAAIELFQLTPVPAALAPRGIVFRLVLGSTFGWGEFPAYTAGIAGAWLIARTMARPPLRGRPGGYPAR